MPPVGTLAEMTDAPPAPRRYEESVLFAASDTIGWLRLSKANPNGTGPDDAVVTGAPAPAAPVDAIGVELARRLLGDHEVLAVRAERDFGRPGVRAAERPLRACDRVEGSVGETEAGDLAGPARVEDVDEVAACGQADRR